MKKNGIRGDCPAADLQTFRQDLQSLVGKFAQDENHYLFRGYPEAQGFIDFLNPYERDVIVVLSPETSFLHDYNFRVNGSTELFVEIKKASWVPLDVVKTILQVKTYAWSTKEVSYDILGPVLCCPKAVKMPEIEKW